MKTRKGSVALEALLTLSAYALMLAILIGSARQLSQPLAHNASVVKDRVLLSSACWELHWFSFNGRYIHLGRGHSQNTSYTAANTTLKTPSGTELDCELSIRSELDGRYVSTIERLRG